MRKMNSLDLGKLRIELEVIQRFYAENNPNSEIARKLNAPIDESKLLAFETKHGIELPSDFRKFLLTVADGCVGPVGGLEKLGQFNGIDWDEDRSSVIIPLGNLALSFPHSKEWNSELLDESHSDEEHDQHYFWYFGDEHVNGAIPICDLGCGLRQLLIVNGPEKGTIWFDDRTDWQGIYPATTQSQSRISFYEWYQDWVSKKLLEIDSKG